MDKRGFTLIELLTVIAIIGILAMIAIPGYIGQQKNAARTEAYTNLQNLRLLEEQHFADQGLYTKSLGTAGKDNDNISDIQQGVPAGGGPAEPTQALPGFKPGAGGGLNFSYWIESGQRISDVSKTPPQKAADANCFIAWAAGNSTGRTNGDVFAIDCNNNRNF